MLIIMNPSATDEQIQAVVSFIKRKNFDAHVSKGEVQTVIGAVGGKIIDPRDIELLDGVKEVIRISSSYKLAGRMFKPEDTIIEVNGVKFGGDNIGLIAGPCTVESYEQMDETAKQLSQIGVKILRGGAFKPRTSPYAFQGLGEEGLKIIRDVADKYNMAVTSEVMEISQIPMCLKYVDILQVGARNMQNFKLLKAVGKSGKPVLLKRGPAATIREFLLAAEHIMANDNDKVILCERGVKGFDSTFTRNTLDIAAIPIIKKYSHLPVIADPSHGTGRRYLVEPLSKAALVAGANGLMIEIHNDPDHASSDGAQSLSLPQFKEVQRHLNKMIGRIDYDNKVLKEERKKAALK